MDVSLARTFLMVAETGSFIDAATQDERHTIDGFRANQRPRRHVRHGHFSQRSKSGAELTGAGELFQKHALAMVRVWQQAQLQVSLADKHRDHVSVGAPLSLWSAFLLKWASGLRHDTMPDVADHGDGRLIRPALTQRLIEGTLDVAILYRPSSAPGSHHRAPVRRGIRAGFDGQTRRTAQRQPIMC